MNAFDIVLLGLVGVGVVVGFLKGLVRILVGMVALVVAFLLASRFDDAVASRLVWTGWSRTVLLFLGYLMLFFGVMLIGGLVSWLARKLMKAAMLGWADRLAGGAMGLVAALLAAALLAYPVVAYAPGGGTLLAHSRFAPYLAAVADLANHLAPADLARRYRDGIRKLRKRWRGEEPREVVRMPGEETWDGAPDPLRGA